MAERPPIHIPEPQRTSHEGGNGAPGLPPTLQERAKPPPEGSTHGERHSTNVQQPLERGRAVFDCAIPKVRPSPFHIRPMLRQGLLREEQAQETEQEWRENLRTWDRQRLEKAVSSLEKNRDRAATLNRQETVEDLEYELEALRVELRQRE